MLFSFLVVSPARNSRLILRRARNFPGGFYKADRALLLGQVLRAAPSGGMGVAASSRDVLWGGKSLSVSMGEDCCLIHWAVWVLPSIFNGRFLFSLFLPKGQHIQPAATQNIHGSVASNTPPPPSSTMLESSSFQTFPPICRSPPHLHPHPELQDVEDPFGKTEGARVERGERGGGGENTVIVGPFGAPLE